MLGTITVVLHWTLPLQVIRTFVWLLLLSHPDTDSNLADNNGVSVLVKIADHRVTLGWKTIRNKIESLLLAVGVR